MTADPTTFMCDNCGKISEESSEEIAIAERERNFPNDTGPWAKVCDECYKDICDHSGVKT